jgi:hypothetical protein
MSVRVTWLDSSHTVIVREFEGAWTWDEYYTSQKQVSEMLLSVKHNVHQIFDFTKSSALPSNTLSHLRGSGRGMPTNRGRSVIVTQSNFYKHMYQLFDRLFPGVTQRVVLVATLEEALDKVRAAETAS